nr:MAG TPA: hypothetical protein [Caudoviricetes sp.]
MKIEKNGKIYDVTELARNWKLSIMIGSVPVIYKVSKDGCATFDELKEFVAENPAF